MSTSVLYRVFGLDAFEHVCAESFLGLFLLTVRVRDRHVRCPGCLSPDVIRRGTRPRKVYAPPVGLRQTVLFIDVPRVQCERCGQVRHVRLPGVVPGKNYTTAFRRLVLDLRKVMTVRDLARYLNVSETLIRSIDKLWLGKKFGKPRLRHLKHLAIDEISVRKGHRYLTIVLDLDTGAVVFVGDGKGQTALKPFWKRLHGSRAKVQAVATDMSSAYYAAVQRNVPSATLVFDRFHIVKLMNEKLTTLRRDLFREASDQLERSVLKGTRWLLLKHPDNLDDERNERQRLEDALQINASLATGYYLKEDLRQIWEQKNGRAAGRFLKDWCARAQASGIRVLQTMANTLLRFRNGILNWYRYPISTGPLEGTNNKIKTLKRQAYGYRDLEYFKLRLMALHLAKFELIG